MIKIIDFFHKLKFFINLILCFCLFPALTYSLTIDEAIQLATENLPSYKAAILKVKSSEALYNASLSPYLPVLDSFFTKNRHYTPSLDHESMSYGITLSYLLFDGGKRYANRDIARLSLAIDNEDLRKNLLDLNFQVKNAFYTTLAMKQTLEQRGMQLEDARKDFDVADGRYKFGVATLLDVLQASVRVEQARFNLIQGEGDLNKALSELYSLIGLPASEKREIKGSLDIEIKLPERSKVLEAALKNPEIKQAENLVKISENNKSLARSDFYPSISASASYTKTDGRLQVTSVREDKTISITASLNIFELGKFFKKKSSEFEENVSLQRLNDIKRVIQLDAYKVYEDIQTAINKLKVAQKQLEVAEHNYKQAFGEYKVGTGDILSLVQAESTLANAREQLISSKLSVIISKITIERITGIENLELLIAN